MATAAFEKNSDTVQFTDVPDAARQQKKDYGKIRNIAENSE